MMESIPIGVFFIFFIQVIVGGGGGGAVFSSGGATGSSASGAAATPAEEVKKRRKKKKRRRRVMMTWVSPSLIRHSQHPHQSDDHLRFGSCYPTLAPSATSQRHIASRLL
jgi:hypothetical protein